jgi:hypothetical protein
LKWQKLQQLSIRQFVILNSKFYTCSSRQAGSVIYRANPIATPPSTFKILPVDLFNNPTYKYKAGIRDISGKIISFSGPLSIKAKFFTVIP